MRMGTGEARGREEAVVRSWQGWEDDEREGWGLEANAAGEGNHGFFCLGGF